MKIVKKKKNLPSYFCAVDNEWYEIKVKNKKKIKVQLGCFFLKSEYLLRSYGICALTHHFEHLGLVILQPPTLADKSKDNKMFFKKLFWKGDQVETSCPLAFYPEYSDVQFAVG